MQLPLKKSVGKEGDGYRKLQNQQIRRTIGKICCNDKTLSTIGTMLERQPNCIFCQLILIDLYNKYQYLTFSLQTTGMQFEDRQHPISIQPVSFYKIKLILVESQKMVIVLIGREDREQKWTFSFQGYAEGLNKWVKLMSEVQRKIQRKIVHNTAFSWGRFRKSNTYSQESELFYEQFQNSHIEIAESHLPNLVEYANKILIDLQQTRKQTIINNIDRNTQRLLQIARSTEFIAEMYQEQSLYQSSIISLSHSFDSLSVTSQENSTEQPQISSSSNSFAQRYDYHAEGNQSNLQVRNISDQQ